MQLVKTSKYLVKILTIFVFTVLGICLYRPQQVLAQVNADNSLIFYEKINPDSTIRYSLKRIIEKVEGVKVDIFDRNQKNRFMVKLSNRRLLELKYIIENNKLFYLEKSSSRYITQLGLISEELDKNKIDADFIKSNLETHTKVLESLKDKFPSQTAQWLLVQQARDTSKSILSKASE